MTKRRRGQVSFNDWFAFGGIPRPEELMDPVLKQLDALLDDEKRTPKAHQDGNAGDSA